MDFTSHLQGLFPFLLFLLPTTVHCLRPPTASPVPPPSLPNSIEAICNLTTHPSICVSAVTPHLPIIPSTTTSVLLVLLKSAKNETAIDKATFSDLASNPNTSPKMVAALENCEYYYEKSLDDYDNAMAAVKAEDLRTVKTHLSALYVWYDVCALGEGPGYPPPRGGPWLVFNDRLTKLVDDCSDLCALVR